MANVNFKIISLNARGIRDLNKWKAIFSWLQKQKAYIVFLQETYSTPDVVEKWKCQWPGKFFYSHGTNHSKGVMILVSDRLQFELKSEVQDKGGRYILIDTLVQDSPFLFLNIYAPNNTAEQCTFFSDILHTLEDKNYDSISQLIIGGDFNAHLDPELDNAGGKTNKKDSVKNIIDITTAFDLADI